MWNHNELIEEPCYWIYSDGSQCKNIGKFSSGYCKDCSKRQNIKSGTFKDPYQKRKRLRSDLFPMHDVGYWTYDKNGVRHDSTFLHHISAQTNEQWTGLYGRNGQDKKGKQHGGISGKRRYIKRRNFVSSI